MKINNVLITGAAGFMGVNLYSRLLKSADMKDSKIVLFYHHEKPSVDFSSASNVVAIQGSLNDYNLLCEIINKYDINTIYHFGSNSIVRKCASDPFNAYLTNVMGTVTLLEAVRNVGMNTIKKIIVSTSDKVYGHAPHPYTEETAFMPKYTYESTKACQDIIAQNYFFNYGLPINIIRCSNIYGPNDPNTSRLIPNVIRCINNKENPKLHSGVKDFIREFVYVEDLIDALFLIESKAVNGEVYCVGGTGDISIIDFINKICKVMNHTKGIDVIEKPANFQEIAEQSIDSSKLKALGWVPKFTLDEGLMECVKSDCYK